MRTYTVRTIIVPPMLPVPRLATIHTFPTLNLALMYLELISGPPYYRFTLTSDTTTPPTA